MSLVRENGNEVETELLDTSLCFIIVMLWLCPGMRGCDVDSLDPGAGTDWFLYSHPQPHHLSTTHLVDHGPGPVQCHQTVFTNTVQCLVDNLLMT